MDIDHLVDIVIAREGGYVDHPADRGGPTCWGITQEVARADGYFGAMRSLPRERAAAIYARSYWTAPGLDRMAGLAPALAAELFDAGVNMGTGTAIGFAQRALNALNRGASDYPDGPVDGKLGTRTLAALAAFLKRRSPGGEAVLVKAVQALRGARYVQLAEERPADEAFLYGWLANRTG
ncbi:glycoside hydrolase family 108 protein [Sphingomonas bacterium]|uniref:glycoside hydrolase family 108 protein n=1 Tax=Sphingomonas bacterium TaxID=1895847 RepID=UPI00157720D8|nr:glycosyl hydrolase 108 family protein [Sphingomonas bacterium]